MKRPDLRAVALILLLGAGNCSALFAANAPASRGGALAVYTRRPDPLDHGRALCPPFPGPDRDMASRRQSAAAYPWRARVLNWAAYVAPRIRVGVELGGTFTFDPNANLLLMLPILAKGAYVFSIYPFEIPVTFGAGINILKYTDQFYVDMLLKPGASLFWIFNSSWSFGFNLNYWMDFQFSSNFRLGNFLEASLTALYHY